MIYTPYTTLRYIHHDDDYEMPKPEPSFEERVALWNDDLRNDTAREVIKSAVSDCEDKGVAFFSAVFTIASILYLTGGVAVYMMQYNSYDEVALFFIFIGSLLASFLTALIIGGVKLDIMVHKIRKRVDKLYEKYEAHYEEERKHMMDCLKPRERQMALEKNMIANKMTIDEFRKVLYTLTSNRR